MLHVGVFALAGGAPRVHIEALASYEPMLADFFGATRDELERLAIARSAIVLNTTRLQETLLVGSEQMPAEAARL